MTVGFRQFGLCHAKHSLLLVLAAVFFSAGFLALMPEAHACLHADSHQPEHQCWLTQYLDQPGMLLAEAAPLPLPGCELIFLAGRDDGFVLPFAFPENFPTRGPPASASALA